MVHFLVVVFAFLKHTLTIVNLLYSLIKNCSVIQLKRCVLGLDMNDPRRGFSKSSAP